MSKSDDGHIYILPTDTPDEARRKVRLVSLKWKLNDLEKAIQEAYFPGKLISANTAALFETAIRAAREENGI